MASVDVPILYWSPRPVTYTNHDKLLSINILILHAHINYKDMVGREICSIISVFHRKMFRQGGEQYFLHMSNCLYTNALVVQNPRQKCD